jgi:hypothetical protein
MKNYHSSNPESTIVRYYKQLALIFLKIGIEPSQGFAPAFELPELTDSLRNFFVCGNMSCASMDTYGGKNLYFLNLMLNPDTQTTKTIPSLLMIARAIAHIQKTGEKILIVTPSSGNKAIALRNAVERALEYKLVTDDQLRILTLTPEVGMYKLRESSLTNNRRLLALNPIGICTHPNPEDLKSTAQSFVMNNSEDLWEQKGLRVWYTLDINNYKVADALRALCCHDSFPEKQFAHAHAVSSAYGLLGFDFGHSLLKERGNVIHDPQYFLVQHLQTHAMVQNVIGEEKFKNPVYTKNDTTGLFEQSDNPYYPFHTNAVDECIDPTFYTRNPATNETMSAIIRKNGGGGIVISKHECLQRYAEIQSLLHTVGLTLPDNPEELHEWSLVMAMTGILTGIDRGLISEDDIMIHGSGCYSNNDYVGIGKEKVFYVKNTNDMRALIY